ncbi:MAG TPA: hypothetical protein VK858_20245, partial [Longimicrobiales bacterium]|nr:hypothetical protein [Longimicrobiales bacterium]
MIVGRRTGPWWRRLRSVLPWTLVAGVGCGLEGPSTPGDVPLGWTAPVVYTLGGADATDWSAFGEVSGVGFDARGWLYVLDGQARRVTVVDTLGERVGTVGAPG